MKTFKEFQEQTVEVSPKGIVGAVTNMLVNKIPNGNKKVKAGEQHQREFTKMIKKMFNEIDAQLEVEPKGVKITPETIIGMINKKDKKKLN